MIYKLIATISLLIALSCGVAYTYHLRQTAIKISTALQEARELRQINDRAQNAVPSNVDPGAPEINENLEIVRKDLKNASERITKIKGASADTIGTTEALAAMDEATRTLVLIEENAREIVQTNVKAVAALTNIHDQYEAKINTLEKRMDIVSSGEVVFSIELILAVISLVVGLSAMLLGWLNSKYDGDP